MRAGTILFEMIYWRARLGRHDKVLAMAAGTFFQGLVGVEPQPIQDTTGLTSPWKMMT